MKELKLANSTRPALADDDIYPPAADMAGASRTMFLGLRMH